MSERSVEGAAVVAEALQAGDAVGVAEVSAYDLTCRGGYDLTCRSRRC